MTTTQAAEILRVSERRVRQLIDLGILKAEKPGREWHVDEASVAARLSEMKRRV